MNQKSKDEHRPESGHSKSMNPDQASSHQKKSESQTGHANSSGQQKHKKSDDHRNRHLSSKERGGIL
jgi:hypothetical protein